MQTLQIFLLRKIVFLLLLTATSLSAQNIKKGFKLLEKLDYAKSKEVFANSISENLSNPAALFGLSLIFADENSPYYDLIQAWGYSRDLLKCIDNLSTEENEIIGEYFYNTEVRHVSRPVRKKIDYAVETIEAKLIKYIREENNLAIVYTVIEKFPDFRHYDNVIHIRNQLEFRKYEKLNQLDGYLEFIRKFPDAAQVDKAKKYINKLAFARACQINTVEAYKEYINNYPEAVELSSAVKKLHAAAFLRARNLNNIAAMDGFIKNYPEALETFEARAIQKQLLYEQAKKIQTLDAYNEFIRRYPEGQQYVDIFNLKSLDKGMQFIRRNPLPSNSIQWARIFDEEQHQSVNACLAVDTANQYLLGSTVYLPDSGSADVWVVKLDENGKMLWNKYLGEGFNSSINRLAITARNEVLGAGITWLGSDSLSQEAWLFKLGSKGEKLWSRRVGKLNVKTLVSAGNGQIFLGGYLVDDSLRMKYSLVVLNEAGKRLWGRTYTGNGGIIYVTELPDQKMLMVGNSWRAKIDYRGYIVWESRTAGDSIIAASLLQRGEIAYLSLRDHHKLFFSKTSLENKLTLEKEIIVPELPLAVNILSPSSGNQLLILMTFNNYQIISWMNTSNGIINNSVRLPERFQIEDLRIDRKNNLLMQSGKGDILLVKNTNTSF
jgi:hypothetical protein